MTSIAIPDIPSLAEATVERLRRGVSDSNSMREQLAARFQFGREITPGGSSSTITPGHS